ncbi:MAG: potassium-transporting ATPase subunit KdpC [Desulfuromonadales bacterium]|nr:potassium-transporting ATPase subunit KdpC [Desulfuromonadales bacterium]
MVSLLRQALGLLAVLIFLTGLVYPIAVTGISQMIFPAQANGSLIVKEGRTVGSALVGQFFDAPGYFWGRPSATPGWAYNASASSGSNLGQANPILHESVNFRLTLLRTSNPDQDLPVPIDLVTASASGLDPHISLEAATYQVRRVARERHLDEARLYALIETHLEKRTFGLLGEPRVNVLQLNLALDDLQ